MSAPTSLPPVQPPTSPGTYAGGLGGNSGRLIIVRHGKTALNSGSANSVDTIRGWLDIPLTDEGRQEARATAQQLGGDGIQYIVCSDLSRAHETAEIVAQIIGVEPGRVQPDPAFRPWNLGIYTGKPSKEAAPAMEHFVENPSEAVPKGESFDSFRTRVLTSLQPILDQVREGVVACLVTHFRDTKLISAWIAQGALPDLSIDVDTFEQDDAPTGSYAVVQLGPDGNWSYSEPQQPDIPVKKVQPKLSENERHTVGQLVSGLIRAGRNSMGSVEEWWTVCERYHRNEFTGAYDYQDWQPAIVPVEVPYSQTRQDMLTAQVCTVIGKQDPYMLSDTAAPDANIKFVQEKVCHKFWQRAGFETKIRQASLIATDTNLTWYRIAWDRPAKKAKPFSGLVWDVIHPKDCVLFPATVGGIPAARLTGHRFYRTIAEIKSLQKGGVYFKGVDPMATGGPEQHDRSGQIQNSGATPGITGPDPEDRLVELWQVVWQWARKEGGERQWYVSTVCAKNNTLYAHEPWPYSRVPYFDTSYIMEANDLYWPGVSVARNLSPLQDMYNRIWTALYNGMMMTIAAPIFGAALPEKDMRFSFFSFVPTDTQAQPWQPTTTFRPEGANQALEGLDILGDRTSRISANAQGTVQDHQTTATESSIIAAGAATGAEEYINNFGQVLGEIADYTMELLAAHFQDWEQEAGLLGAKPEILLQPANWEQNGKTPGNTPGAKLAGISQISQFAAQFGPATGIDIYELTTTMLQNSPFQGADGIQKPKEQVQAEQQAQQAQQQAQAAQQAQQAMGTGAGQAQQGPPQGQQGPQAGPPQGQPGQSGQPGQPGQSIQIPPELLQSMQQQGAPMTAGPTMLPLPVLAQVFAAIMAGRESSVPPDVMQAFNQTLQQIEMGSQNQGGENAA